MRVLVVDDESDIRMVIHAALDSDTCLDAADGPTALSLLDRHPVDVVLLDVMMPGMDGLEVLRRLRQTLGGDVPVVMLTARGAESDHVHASRAGADAYVTKPFDIDELAAVVAEVVARSPKQRLQMRAVELGKAELLRRLETAFPAR